MRTLWVAVVLARPGLFVSQRTPAAPGQGIQDIEGLTGSSRRPLEAGSEEGGGE